MNRKLPDQVLNQSGFWNTHAFGDEGNPSSEPEWDKTEHVLARLKGTPFFEEGDLHFQSWRI